MEVNEFRETSAAVALSRYNPYKNTKGDPKVAFSISASRAANPNYF